jgi:hypothetical protein
VPTTEGGARLHLRDDLGAGHGLPAVELVAAGVEGGLQ